MAALGHDRCSVCLKRGGGGCVSCSPVKTFQAWEMFSSQEIIDLLAEACQELHKRDSRLPVMVSA